MSDLSRLCPRLAWIDRDIARVERTESSTRLLELPQLPAWLELCKARTMDVGILGGTGPAGRGLAARLSASGLEVVIGSRDASRAVQACQEVSEKWPQRTLGLHGGDNAAAAGADLVVVATPWDGAGPTVSSIAGSLKGKVVISMANALVKVGDELQALTMARGSVAQGVAAAAPQAKVAAAFHHLPARELADLDHELEADVLVCADDPEAMAATMELTERMPRLRALEAGGLASAAPVEAFTAVLLGVNIRYRTRAAVRLTGVDPERRK